MADRRRTTSVTRLLGLNLTPGKLRGLQRISNANGTLTMVALDQNSSMISMIKDTGADGVTLLAQFAPPEPASAEQKFSLIRKVYEECQKHDILMLLETVAFPFDGEKKDSKSFFERKAETVIESARQLSRFCDVYKAEFPGNLGRENDQQLQENLRQLDKASERPWVLLSAGV